MIKGTIQQEDIYITLVKFYAPNIGTPKYVRQILMDIKRQINRNTITVGDFNNLLISMGKFFRQKINKDSGLKQLSRSRGFN